MTDADNLGDRLTGKIFDSSISTLTKAAKQIGEALMFFIFSAAATATDPFFRKNMGERYFTPLRMFISTIGWFALFFVSFYFQAFFYGVPSLGIVVGLVIPFAYMGMAYFNYLAIRERQETGELWHSKSRGESLFGSENAKRDGIIEIVVFIGLCCCSKPHAAFFFLSRLMAYAAEAAAQAALYNRYLDIQDARIEAEFMETALRDGFPPRKTAGIFRPLPDTFKGERRANVARIVTGGPFIDPPKIEPAQTKPPAPPVFAP